MRVRRTAVVTVVAAMLIGAGVAMAGTALAASGAVDHGGAAPDGHTWWSTPAGTAGHTWSGSSPAGGDGHIWSG